MQTETALAREIRLAERDLAAKRSQLGVSPTTTNKLRVVELENHLEQLKQREGAIGKQAHAPSSDMSAEEVAIRERLQQFQNLPQMSAVTKLTVAHLQERLQELEDRRTAGRQSKDAA